MSVLLRTPRKLINIQYSYHLPIINSLHFIYFSEIECTWNDELLIINEDIHHIQTGHVIMLFELVDILIGGESTSEMNGSSILF